MYVGSSMPFHLPICLVCHNFLQSKFYARSYGNILTADRRDSDRMIVCYTPQGERCDKGLIEDAETIIIATTWILSMLVTLLGVYYIPAFIKDHLPCFQSNSAYFKLPYINHYYVATSLVLGVINITCFGIHLSPLNTNLKNIHFETRIITLISLLFLFEIIVVYNRLFYLVRGSKQASYIIPVHTIAICNMLWFLRLMGCNLLVAFFFMALAPAQTLAALALIYFSIISMIMLIVFTIRHVKDMKKDMFKNTMNLFLSWPVYILVIALSTLLTFLFNELIENGLGSSDLGSIILSLISPIIVFLITVMLGKELEIFKLEKCRVDCHF